MSSSAGPYMLEGNALSMARRMYEIRARKTIEPPYA